MIIEEFAHLALELFKNSSGRTTYADCFEEIVECITEYEDIYGCDDPEESEPVPINTHVLSYSGFESASNWLQDMDGALENILPDEEWEGKLRVTLEYIEEDDS